jgi:hypothetical protein
MLFMIVERFKNRDPRPIYRRLQDAGRQMPEGFATSTVGSSQISTAVSN